MQAGFKALGVCCLLSWALASHAPALEVPPAPFSKLSSPKFHDRESAQAELLAWGRKNGNAARDLFFAKWRSSADPETRARCLQILRELVDEDYLAAGEGYIGISMMDEVRLVPGDSQPQSAIRINVVQGDSPGQKSGLMVGDVIVAADGASWHGVAASTELTAKVKKTRPRTKLVLKVIRNDVPMEVVVILGRRPSAAGGGPNFDLHTAEAAEKEAVFSKWLEQKSKHE